MKFGVVVFPGSNCDRDMMESLQNDLQQEVIQLWHKDKDLAMFTTDDCIVLPGGFSYGDYLRCGAIIGNAWHGFPLSFEKMVSACTALADGGFCGGDKLFCGDS